MKKLLFALIVITTAGQIMPEWREHHGILGGALNTAEAVVESPRYIVDPNYDGYHDDYYYDNDGYRRDDRRYRNRNYKRNARSSSETNRSTGKKTTRNNR